MLKLLNTITLTKRSMGYLAKWQNIIDSESTYEAQITKAKATWGKSNKTFDEIKKKLRQMLNDTDRCAYCEDSYADEIEHIYPKSIYPEKTFVWENYLYACGPCNGPKNSQFALIDSVGQLQNITPPLKIPEDYVFRRPAALQAALIDPRVENPLQFLELDITSTFRFVPAIGLNAQDHLRALFTIRVLRLNDREYLVKAREKAFENYKARLKEYIEERNKGATQPKLDKLISGIKEGNHQTVWFEIKRFHSLIPELKRLFIEEPTALNW